MIPPQKCHVLHVVESSAACGHARVPSLRASHPNASLAPIGCHSSGLNKSLRLLPALPHWQTERPPVAQIAPGPPSPKQLTLSVLRHSQTSKPRTARPVTHAGQHQKHSSPSSPLPLLQLPTSEDTMHMACTQWDDLPSSLSLLHSYTAAQSGSKCHWC